MLLSEIRNTNKVKSFNEVQVEKSANGKLVVYCHKSDKPLIVYRDTPYTISSQKPKAKDPTSVSGTDSEKESIGSLDELSAFLPDRVTKTLGTEGFKASYPNHQLRGQCL